MDEETLIQTLRKDIAEIFNDMVFVLDNRFHSMEANIEQKFIDLDTRIDKKLLETKKHIPKQHQRNKQNFTTIKQNLLNCEEKTK